MSDKKLSEPIQQLQKSIDYWLGRLDQIGYVDYRREDFAKEVAEKLQSLESELEKKAEGDKILEDSIRIMDGLRKQNDKYRDRLELKEAQLQKLKEHSDLKQLAEGDNLKVFITKASTLFIYTIADKEGDIIRDYGSIEQVIKDITNQLTSSEV